MRTLAALALMASPAFAEPAVGDCEGWQANARNVDWTQPSPTFANGAIRLIALDTEEPAAAAFHLMVLYPDADEMFLDCKLISAGLEGSGFAGINLGGVISNYDPAKGLLINVPITAFGADGDDLEASILVTINRATGEVTAVD